MSLQFGKEIAVPVIKEEIVIGGQVVGTVGTGANGGSRYHAVMKVPGLAAVLLQGHGDTREEAVMKALERGRQEAEKVLQYIDQLNALLTSE